MALGKQVNAKKGSGKRSQKAPLMYRKRLPQDSSGTGSDSSGEDNDSSSKDNDGIKDVNARSSKDNNSNKASDSSNPNPNPATRLLDTSKHVRA